MLQLTGDQERPRYSISFSVVKESRCVELALQQQTPRSKSRTETATTLKRTCNCPGLDVMGHIESIRPDGLKDVTAKAGQDAYSAQLEAQQWVETEVESIYGSGVEIIRPDPGFVIKTKTADGLTRVYINVCTTPRVRAYPWVC